MKITLNPDQEIVQTIREGLKRTGGDCPCRVGVKVQQDGFVGLQYLGFKIQSGDVSFSHG